MKKILSLAFITAIFLLGCSADGFFDPETGKITWGKVCKVGETCSSVDTKEDCDAKDGSIVARSECPEGVEQSIN